MKVTSIILFAFLALSASAAVTEWGYPEEENVIVLTESIFDEVVGKHDFILVEFYAPWCGHCKKLAPEYAKAAAALKAEEQAIPLAKVDATAETSLASKYQVSGYPTLKLFVKGQPMEYTGGRTEKEIVSWLLKKSGPSSVELKTSQDVENFLKQNVAVVFFGEASASQFTVFQTVSASFEDVAFGYTHNAELIQENKAETNTIVVFKQFDEGRVAYTGPLEAAQITTFIKDNQFPVVLEVSATTAPRIFGERRDVLLVFVKSVEDPAIEQLRATEGALKGKILLAYSTFVDFGKRVADYFGVLENEAPTVRIIKQSQDMIKFKPTTSEVTTENMIAFYNAVTDGSIEPFYKSEEIPATNDEPVKVIVSKTWKQLVEDETKDVLVEFYAPWCGHCKALAPIYDSLAKNLEGSSNLVIAKMDATANEVSGQSIQGFPTLRFFPTNNKKRPIEFKGDRTEEGILKFLKENATVQVVEGAADQKTEL